MRPASYYEKVEEEDDHVSKICEEDTNNPGRASIIATALAEATMIGTSAFPQTPTQAKEINTTLRKNKIYRLRSMATHL